MLRYRSNIKYAAAFLLAIMVASCSNEVDIINQEQGSETVKEMIPVTVTVTETSSRVSHTNDGKGGLTVGWEEDDVIFIGSPAGVAENKIINAEGSGFSTLTISSINEDNKTATFKGEIPTDLSGKNLLAFYGNPENLLINNGTVVMDFTKQTQAAADLSHLKKYDLMSAVVPTYDGSSDISLNFNHEGAMLKVQLTGLPEGDKSLSKVTLSFPENSAAGFVTQKTFDANGTSNNGNAVNSIDLDLGNLSTEATTFDAVFTLCTIESTNEAKMNINLQAKKASGAYSYNKEITAGGDLIAGKYYYTPELNMVADNTVKGTGTENDPYIIDNAEKFVQKIVESEKFYSITEDINLSGSGFTTVDNFKGTLDGNNKTLSHVSVSGANAGFFTINSGTIKDLKLSNITVSGTPTDHNNFAGIMAGQNTGTIENCEVLSSNITVSGGSDGNIGGFVGINGGNITDCKVSSTNVNAQCKARTGGFVGYNMSTLTGCASADGVTVNTDIDLEINNMDIGGLVGWNGNGATVQACYSHASLTTRNGSHRIGGLIGSAGSNSKVLLSYSSGSITINNNSGSGIGGLIGKATDKWTSNITVTGCYTKVGLPTNTDKMTTVSGFIGKNEGTGLICTSCYFNNVVEGNAVNGSKFSGVTHTTFEGFKDYVNTMTNAANVSGYQFVAAEGDIPVIIEKTNE